MKTLTFISALMMSALSFAETEVRYVGRTNDYGYLACIQQKRSTSGSWVDTKETSPSNCIVEHRYVTGEEKEIVYENCFEQGLAVTEEGSLRWFYVSLATQDPKLCLDQRKISKYVATANNGIFSCFEQVPVLEARKGGAIVPVWKYLDYRLKDQELCSKGIDRFVPSIYNEMLRACHEQTAVTLESGEVNWLYYDYLSRDLRNCILDEKCEQDQSSRKWYRKVAINAITEENSNNENIRWVYLNYIAHENSRCGN